MEFVIRSSEVRKIIEIYGDKAGEAIFQVLTHKWEPFAYPAFFEVTPRAVELSQKKEDNQSIAIEILSFLNDQTGRKFKPIPANLKLIKSLLKAYDRKDLEYVIVTMTERWSGTDMEEYLQPSTLFRASNFDKYLNKPKTLQSAERDFSNELDSILEGNQ